MRKPQFNRPYLYLSTVTVTIDTENPKNYTETRKNEKASPKLGQFAINCIATQPTLYRMMTRKPLQKHIC